MSASARGAFSSLLPWAALAVMTIFFFVQVSARDKAQGEATKAKDDLRALQAARSLAPVEPPPAETLPPTTTPTSDPVPQGATADASTAEAPRAQTAAHATAVAALEASRAAESALRAERDGLLGRLERLEAVRATEAARIRALEKERDDTDAEREGAEADRASQDAERAALLAQRDAATEKLRTLEREFKTLEEELAALRTQAAGLLARAEATEKTLANLPKPVATSTQDIVAAWVASVHAASTSPDATGPDATKPDAAGPAQASPSVQQIAALGVLWFEEPAPTRLEAFAKVLATLPTSPTAARLATALVTADVPPEQAARAARLLARRHLGGPAPSMRLMAHEAPAVRDVILSRLGVNAPRWTAAQRVRARGLLTRLLTFKDPSKRRDAARGLGLLGDAAATPALTTALGAEDRTVRHAAAWALTKLPRSPATVDPLRALAKTLLVSPDIKDVGEGVWLAQWVLGQAQNAGWLETSDQNLRRVARRLRARLDG